MKKSLFLLICSITCLNTFSQNLQWAKRMGGKSSEEGNSIVVDHSGNIYTTGYFQGKADFDPGVGADTLTSNGSADIYISKLDSSGNLVWSKRIGGSGIDIGWSIALDASGNVYTTGYFSGTADFDPGPGTYNLISNGSFDVFILKLNASGGFVWAKSFGGINEDEGQSIVVDASGNVYTTGFYFGTVDFNPGTGISNLTSVGSIDIYILKLDASGNFVWAKSIGGAQQDLGESITLDALGNIYTTGAFMDSVDFDPGPGAYKLFGVFVNAFILKLDNSGNFIWAKNIGGIGQDQGTSIQVDASGMVYTLGMYEDIVDFDPNAGTFNQTSLGDWDMFILKLDGSGNFVWAKSIGSDTLDIGYSLALDPLANVYITGYFSKTISLVRGSLYNRHKSVGNSDVFILKSDSSGKFVWGTSFGGTQIDESHSIAVDAAGNIHTTGFFSDTANFDTGIGTYSMVSSGGRDIFVSRIGSCSFTITTQPISKSVAAGSNVSFSLTSSNTSVTYQWQQNIGFGFVNLSNNAQFSGVTNSNLIINNVTLSQNNYSYACIVTSGSCSIISNSAVLNITKTGMNNLINKNIFSVYPNPANDLITIQADKVLPNITYTILDQTGREVLSGTLKNKTELVNISNLARGFYFVQVGEMDKEIFKLVKE
jgi:hypothetical protein